MGVQLDGSPTTYSHTELVYSILDQENIARGHAAYYLKWSDQALPTAATRSLPRRTQVVLLPEAAGCARRRSTIEAGRDALRQFDFVKATFAAQKAFRAAAAYRDLALGLAPGTTSSRRAPRRKAPRPASRPRARARTRRARALGERPTRPSSLPVPVLH